MESFHSFRLPLARLSGGGTCPAVMRLERVADEQARTQARTGVGTGGSMAVIVVIFISLDDLGRVAKQPAVVAYCSITSRKVWFTTRGGGNLSGDAPSGISNC